MNLSFPKTNRVNVVFPDKAEFWSNKCLTKEKYQVLLPSGSLTMWEMGNKANRLECQGIQVEQWGMDKPCLAQMGSEQTLTTHIYL